MATPDHCGGARCIVRTRAIGMVGTLEVEESATVSITFSPKDVGMLLNTVSVRAGEFDPAPNENLQVLTTEVVSPPPANLILSAGSTPPSAGARMAEATWIPLASDSGATAASRAAESWLPAMTTTGRPPAARSSSAR